MAIRRIPVEGTTPHPELAEQLSQELRSESPETDHDAPLIIEEAVPNSGTIFVTVIWDAWNSLSGEDRGAVILDAYERYGGLSARQSVSVALGLTRAEAIKLNVMPEAVAA